MGSKSSSTATTTQNEYFDQRSVNDAGGGIVGNGNSQDSSQTWLQTTTDSRKNINSGNTTWTADNSQTWTQNTNQSDSSSKSYSNSGNTTWTSNVTDGGAFDAITTVGLAQTDMVGKLAKIASDNASAAASAAAAANERAMSAVAGTTNSAFDFAKSNNAMAFKSSADALGFAGDKFDEVAGLTKTLLTSAQKQADSAAGTVAAAYNSAASQANGNKTLVIAALAAVAVVAAAVVFRKG